MDTIEFIRMGSVTANYAAERETLAEQLSTQNTWHVTLLGILQAHARVC